MEGAKKEFNTLFLNNVKKLPKIIEPYPHAKIFLLVPDFCGLVEFNKYCNCIPSNVSSNFQRNVRYAKEYFLQKRYGKHASFEIDSQDGYYKITLNNEAPWDIIARIFGSIKGAYYNLKIIACPQENDVQTQVEKIKESIASNSWAQDPHIYNQLKLKALAGHETCQKFIQNKMQHSKPIAIPKKKKNHNNNAASQSWGGYISSSLSPKSWSPSKWFSKSNN